MILRFPPPAKPWSTNDDRRFRHWRQRADLISAWKHATRLYARSKRVKNMGMATVEVTIPFGRNARRDPHNYVGTVCKAIVDGLVLAGVWPDDGPDYVRVLEPKLVVGDEVIVVVTPSNVKEA